jgi:uncharacterized membrane protein YfcA
VELSPELFGVCAAAFLAGFIDAIVGGGGLVQLPALFIFMTTQPDAALLGTNKLSSIMGTSVATWRYARSVDINWRIALVAAGTAFAFSFMGASAVRFFPKEALRPLILILLVGVAIYTAVKKDLGDSQHLKNLPNEFFYAVAIGAGLGFYDGFFGPGAGSFLIFSFILIFGFDFLRASATAKVVNFSTNLAAVIYFGATNNLLFHVGIPMGACNILGAVLGTQLAILRGSGFVRVFFLGVIALIIAKFGHDTIKLYLQ